MLIWLLFLQILSRSITNAEKLFQPKIVGGSIAGSAVYPYQISIMTENGHSCGGAILDETTVLTAAHCVARNLHNPEAYMILTGVNRLYEYKDVYAVQSIRIPNSYTTFDQYDIAILKLSKPITFSDRVKPIELETKHIGAGVSCESMGWGELQANKGISRDLMYIRLITISQHACQKAQPHNSHTIHSSQICTFTKRGEGVCRGDSGGPLVANGKLIGITSWSRPCALGYPDVFTRISSYLDWIQTNR